MQTIQVLDKQTGALLAMTATGRFGRGHYERFLVQGPRQLRLRVNKHRGPCVVVSGLFLDTHIAPQSAPYNTFGLSPAFKAVSAEWDSFRKSAEQAHIAALLSPECRRMEKAIAAAMKPLGDKAPAGLLWMQTEMDRFRGRFPQAQASLAAYMKALAREAPESSRQDVLAATALELASRGMSPAFVLTAIHAAASEARAEAAERFDKLVASCRPAGVKRSAPRWLAANPLPAAAPKP